MTSNPNDTLPVAPFLHSYAICYGLLLLAATAFVAFTKLPANAGLGLGLLIGSATFAAQRFLAVNGRVANTGEQIKLIFGSLLITFAFSMAAIFMTALSSGMTSEQLAEVVGSLAGEGTAVEWLSLIGVIVGFTAISLWVSYGPLARILASLTKR